MKRKNPLIISVMIPALNEEKVLVKTVRGLLSLPHLANFEILIIDDNSDDKTPLIAGELAAKYKNVYLLRRGTKRSRQGKGDVLNHGFSYLCNLFSERDLENWIIGVFDADGRVLDEDLLIKAQKTFHDHSVSAVQCGVRIRNNTSILTSLQDIEFSTVAFITQTVRDHISGAVALGGNGQFIRATVLDQLKQEGYCWSGQALTEDLDIGIRIHLNGGEIRFINRWIDQEGVESFTALLKQRHRWAWGTLQVFLKYIVSGKIISANMSLAKKIDLHYSLSLWFMAFAILFSLIFSFLDLIQVLNISNSFGPAFLLANSFGFVPLIILGLVWFNFPMYKIFYITPLAVIYAYHWIPVVIFSWASILAQRKPRWAKTLRYTMGEATK